MAGIVAKPEGITNPPIDELMDKVDSKYALVVFAARRARQINAYNLQMENNMVQFVGPVVPVEPDDKPLGTALREINEGLLVMEEKHAGA
ncbi:MAG: DNA-directed RNA polymerase subunit omega [Actinomycetaceae bacterium]|nr:DNA-directed RNA polymerase subunit omega [Actinomycetaceae bacterium]